ncbi:peptidoglycan DD-metalloendopeptidase family protein [Sutcliffiella horikoshii]|uniref:peptidoglycan DD-metalloendopeptidase family protein n=1 Tax=Sutcliffiella horikoshii TaxID=79883 RepID=UPI001CBF5819|nr:peptidoglycan DD-metalloendopeptidase family protein [Sutcliffiella horikoshii]UAL47431.1 peptidoglycan DD-metalloendopeptidase family protein [Sutcliffiella horikoshii]
MMNRLKRIYSNYTEKQNSKHKFQKNRLSTFTKRVMVTTIAASTITLGAVAVHASENSLLGTVYHVYLNGERVGAVDDKEQLDKALEAKVESVQKDHKDLELSVGEQVTVVPEKVFRPSAENKETIDTVIEQVEVKASASVLTIEGEEVALLKNEEEAEKVMELLKLEFVSEKDLKALEERQENQESKLPELKENESRVLDLTIKEKVSYSDKNVDPKNVVSVKEAVELIKKGKKQADKYEVQAGDSLGDIAEKHDLSSEELLEMNPDIAMDTLLKVGKVLNVSAKKPYLNIVVKQEVSKNEEVPYEQEVVEDKELPKGETKVKQQGENGEKNVRTITTKENGMTIKTEVTHEETLKEPVKHIVVKGTKVIPSRGSGSLAWPAVGGYISSKMGHRWGKMHKGIDIARPSDRTIKAADNGVVESAGWDGGYGNKVVINHQNGMKTTYAHLDSISVSVGQTVSRGGKIGVMGTTGQSTGVHLHFEVYQDGKLKDPMQYLNN